MFITAIESCVILLLIVYSLIGVYNFDTVGRLEVVNQRWIIIMVFYKGTNHALSHHVANISRCIELEITEVVIDLSEALSFGIVDNCVTDRLMIVTS